MRIFIVLITGLTATRRSAIISYDANEPEIYTPSINQVLMTQTEIPEQVELEQSGQPIPEWLNGYRMYRNGPGKYEFGSDQFQHFFDPSSILQQVEFKNGSAFYNSKYLQSRNFKTNSELNRIIYPELGTYAEPDWISHDQNGEILSDEEIEMNRRLFFLEPEAKTDNALVSIHEISGNLIAFGETMYLHTIDGNTLDTLDSFSIEDATNFPKEFIGMTQTAHGVYDKNGNFINMVTGMLFEGLSDGKIRPPKIAYFIYRVPDARTVRRSLSELLECIEFSEPTFNLKQTDFGIRYMHQGLLAGNYFLGMFSSTKTDMHLLQENIKNGEPILTANIHDPDAEQEIRIFNLEKFKWENHPNIILPSGIMLHHINAFVEQSVQAAGNSKQQKFTIDTMWSGNPETISLYYLESLRSSGLELDNLRDILSPAGIPVRLTFQTKLTSNAMDESSMNGEENERRGNIIQPEIEILSDRDLENNNQWQAYVSRGVEFPMINKNLEGSEYNHFWGVGYAQVLGDRLYHTQLNPFERHVYLVEGYEPSEPIFIPNPSRTGSETGSDEETDGVILASFTPTDDPSLEAFVAILNPADLTEITRLYFPVGYRLSTAFHGMWTNTIQ